MRHRLILIAVVVTAAFVVTAATAHAAIKIAYVDIQRALNECQAGNKAKQEMRSRFMVVQKKLQHEQNEVKALQNELQKKGMLMQTSERQNLQDQYSVKLRDFQQNYKNAEAELRQKDNELTAAIVSDLAAVVRNIGEKDGYTMVMEKGQILWGIPSIDITDQVIRTYDGMHVQAGSLGEKSNKAAARRSSNQLNLGDAGSSADFGSKVQHRRSTISR